MIERKIDRRKSNRNSEFPMTDSSGHYVGADRRCGFDRRTLERDDIALKIIKLVDM